MSDFPLLPVTPRSLSCRDKLFGIGINDANYLTSPYIDGKQIRCPIYAMWARMFERAYCSKKHAKFPSYIGCTVDERWHSFMSFREWVLAQPHWEGLELDKDLLFPGNKVYSPDTCLFVSIAVNAFLTHKKKTGSLTPVGITQRPSGKYRVEIQDGNGSRWRSTVIADLDSAINVYNQKKLEFAQDLASVQTDPRVASALLKYFDQA